MAEAHAEAESAAEADLASLRKSGAERADPVRFAYLAALVRRAAQQPQPVRRLLNARIAIEAGRLMARHRPHAAAGGQGAASPANSPLAELLAYIEENAALPEPGLLPAALIQPPPHPASEDRARQPAELKSVARFRSTWSRLGAERQLVQTLAQAPENAGPMNSQHLVLRALQVMRDCSPEYLQGFMSYVDTLLWLEHAAAARPAERRQERTKKGEGQAPDGGRNRPPGLRPEAAAVSVAREAEPPRA